MTFELEAGDAVDLSQTIRNGMTTYVGDPVPSIRKVKQIRTDGVNISEVLLGSHTGTHVDAPLHFVEGGKSIDALSPERCVGEAAVIDLGDKPQGSEISAEDLGKGSLVDKEGLVVLLYTGMSRLWENPAARTNFTYLSSEAAEWLVRKKVKAVGIDYLSVEKFGSRDAPVHKMLLSNGVPIVESLNEKLGVFAGKHIFFVCLPLKIGGSDGGPARALAYPLKVR